MASPAKVTNSSGEEVSVELVAMMTKCKIPTELQKLLADKDFLECNDVTLLGDSEKEVVDAVKTVLPTDGSITLDITLGKNLKKLWGLCCQAAPKPGSGSASVASAVAVDDETPLPQGVPEAIEKAWANKHGFHLSGARLLVGGDYNRIYNCLQKRPIELPKMDPQKFRLQNEGVTGESKGFFSERIWHCHES